MVVALCRGGPHRAGVVRIVQGTSASRCRLQCCPSLVDEIPSNRRMAQDLVEKWSRPILAARQTHKGEDAEELRILAARKARLASSKPEVRGMSLPCSHDSSPNLSVPVHGRRGARVQEQVEYKAEEHEVALKPGEPGFRWHASIPRAATLDYVRRPEPKVAVADSRASSSTKDKSGRFGLVLGWNGRARRGGAGPRSNCIRVCLNCFRA